MSNLAPMRLDCEWTREQRATMERLSLEHGNASAYIYRSSLPGRTIYATFDDDYRVNIDEDGRLH